MLSNTCKYAIRATVYVGLNNEDGKKIGIKKISEELEMPAPFLGKIMQTLAKNKILVSTKGPNGGFALGKKPEDISLLDIIRIFDGLDIFHECVIGLKFCEKDIAFKKKCPYGSRIDPLLEQFYKEFEKQTIADFAHDYEDVKSML